MNQSTFNDGLSSHHLTVAFGRFEAVHIGHRSIINELRKDTNHLLVLLPDEYGPVLNTETERCFLLEKAGIKNILPLSEQESVESFVEELDIDEIICGKNCKHLQGITDYSRKKGIFLQIKNTVEFDGIPITTDLIKETIKAEEYSKYLELSGAPFVISGKIIHGKGRGRLVNMPTANLMFSPQKILPPYGVYIARIHLEGEELIGVTNVGLRPSDDNINKPTVETFIDNFDRLIYDKYITVELCSYLRKVKKFSGLSEVKKQVDKDMAKAREFFKK